MSVLLGKFVWYELMTDDLDAAGTFYGTVVGWRTEDAGMGARPYTICSVGNARIAGLMALPEPLRAAGAKPHWLGYIWADDVDATAVRVTQAGGTIHRAPDDIPGIGRFCVVADPQGAVFVLFRGTSESAERPALFAPGSAGWNELYASEWQSAFAFYADLFGWQTMAAVDMGPMGTYQLFGDGGAMAIGGMMTKPEAVPRPAWGFYFVAEDVDAAAERVKAHGGQIVNGPHAVPGGSWIIQCLDPQGAYFCMVGQRH
jgi:predicted enzyme related to lactoylglutathione lyase